MNLKISAPHLEITPALHAHIQKKLGKIKTHFDYEMDVKFTLSVEKLNHVAESTIHLPGTDIYAKCMEQDMYRAIELLINKLDRQVKKYKEKNKDHHRSDKLTNY
jgi:putative sigma-54 modulation protein